MNKKQEDFMLNCWDLVLSENSNLLTNIYKVDTIVINLEQLLRAVCIKIMILVQDETVVLINVYN